jgi:hypothetical protein
VSKQNAQSVSNNPKRRPRRRSSLLISPVIAGLLMALVGSTLRKRGKKVVRLESFGYGFAFAFGMAFIRLIFAR